MALSEKIKPIRVTTILEKITKSNKPEVAGHEGLEKITLRREILKSS